MRGDAGYRRVQGRAGRRCASAERDAGREDARFGGAEAAGGRRVRG